MLCSADRVHCSSYNTSCNKLNLVVIFVVMNDSKRDFYKGIPGLSRLNPEVQWAEAERGIYGMWWRFLRLSPVFWFARTSGITPKHRKLAQIYEQAGDISEDRFAQWWRTAGAALYVDERPLRVRVLDERQSDRLELYPEGKSILVEVPLTIRQGTIIRQLRQELSQWHAGRGLNVMEHSGAQWRLHTKRYQLTTLDKEYWVLVYRLLYPDIAAWRIGDRLGLSQGLNLRDIDHWKFNRKTSPQARMSSTIGRFLYKAQRTLRNAEQGSFPNAAKSEPIEKPFGTKHHNDYLSATGLRIDAVSPWHQWLKREYHAELVRRVKVSCGFTGVRATDPRLLKRLPPFIAGESDLLA